MNSSTWLVVKQAFPGPAGFAAWIAVTVAAPILHFDQTHRWEETQQVSTALWWVVGALPVLAATVAARWTWRATELGPAAAFPAAVLAATFVSAGFLAGTLAFYRWVIPLSGEFDWWIWVLGGLAATVVAAAIGHGLGRLGRHFNRASTEDGGQRPATTGAAMLVGAAVTVIGAFLLPMTLQLGSEDSTVAYDEGHYGGVGPDAEAAGESGTFTLGGGRYAIMAMGFAPHDPDCRISGEGLIEHPADLVTLPPSDYGSDAASYAWIASFTVPGPGTYSLTCQSTDEAANYTVGEIPEIRGAVGALIQWPLPVIWLLGGLPGLLIIANALRRRARQADHPATAW